MSGQRICVISLGVNSPSPLGHPTPTFQDFSRGIARIREDLLKFNFKGDFIPWDQHYPEGSPTQQEVPGAFKPFCFNERYFVRKYQEYNNDNVLKQVWRFGKRLLYEYLFILKRIFKKRGI